MTSEEAKKYAKVYDDVYGFSVDDFVWAEEDLPVQALIDFSVFGTRESWIEWLNEEARWSEYPETYYPMMEKWVSETRCTDEPIILTGEDIWDGWHRSACAVKLGLETIRAVIGRPIK